MKKIKEGCIIKIPTSKEINSKGDYNFRDMLEKASYHIQISKIPVGHFCFERTSCFSTYDYSGTPRRILVKKILSESPLYKDGKLYGYGYVALLQADRCQKLHVCEFYGNDMPVEPFSAIESRKKKKRSEGL